MKKSNPFGAATQGNCSFCGRGTTNNTKPLLCYECESLADAVASNMLGTDIKLIRNRKPGKVKYIDLRKGK